MLEVSGLTVRYGQHRALEGAGLRVDPGEIVVILGANGAGKSTLLKAMAGICEGAVAGEVTLNGTDLMRLSPDRIVATGLALVPEGRGVFGELTVRENLTLGAYTAQARAEEARNLSRVLELFPKLAERADQRVRTMSGGEQQMVAIGRAMMSNPEILMLDEPSLGLSPLLSRDLFRSLAAVRDLGLGVLLVEQNARQSLAIADRGYLLENGHIVHADSARALASDPAVQAAYLGAGGGETAPHTYDDPADAAPAEPAAAPFPIRARTLQTVPADALLGRPVADLVAEASTRSSGSVAARRVPPAEAAPPAHAADRLAATLSEIERAAGAARRSAPAQTGPAQIDPAQTGPEQTGPERPGATKGGRSGPPSPPRAPRLTAPRGTNGLHHGPEPAPPLAPGQPADPGPLPRIEVYRAPRVEVYRRRPGAETLERT